MVQIPNDEVLGFGVILILVQAAGQYMIIRYLDPRGILYRSRSNEKSW